MNSSTRQDLINKLFQSNDYSDLKDNRLRVKYILEHFMTFSEMKEFIQENIKNVKSKFVKNMAIALNFKAEADLLLQNVSLGPTSDINENLNKALKSYTRAILYLPILQDPRTAAKLFARKSQIYLNRKEFPEALYQINMGLDILNKYYLENNELQHTSTVKLSALPYKILKINVLKMMARYQEALEMLDEMLMNVDDAQWLSDLSKLKTQIQLMATPCYNECSCFPSVFSDNKNVETNKLKNEEYFNYRIDDRCMIRKSPVVGRHFIAREDIPESTVILEEKPYSVVLEGDYFHQKCSFCFQALEHKFFPCLFCIEIAFCDRKCYEAAYNSYHRYECGLISLLKSLTSPSFHVFRMLSRIGPWNGFKAEQEKHQYSIEEYLQEESQRTLREAEKTMNEKINTYKMSSILLDHDTKHSNYSNIHHIIIGIELSILLDQIHQMGLDVNHEHFMDFIQMVILDIRRIIFNVFGWHEYNSDWTLRGHVANCQCLVGSLVNHSCVANTNWEVSKGQIKFTTNKLIKKGEEITITYGPHKDIPYNKRQERLNHYFFACHCAACLNDAGQGSALKCFNRCPNGLVPFDMALDNEPVLSGQCLLCFNKYPDFHTNVEEMKSCLEKLEVINKFVLFNPSHNWFLMKKAEDLFIKFLNLSVTKPENINVNKALTSMTNIVKNCHMLAEQKDAQLELIADWIDSFPPLQMETMSSSLKNVDTFETIENLFYWYNLSKDYLELNYGSRNYTDMELSDNKSYFKIWNALHHFRKRIENVFNDYHNSSSKHHKSALVSGMIQDIQNQMALI